ncbi:MULTISPECIES: heme A synthase [unclassified Synechocystis]|uniref:COX15/CtaA family protein n=1 Tax=unclassified Synechocystis TaxID=2640012 RepID=UPI0003FDCF00|nr:MULTISPECIES: heme A synthase [unclassified Synechocystis]AIE74264.1 Heme A synthase, cytochrome oxidase biogenesis protein Cox15-CtaA [Synechocystis sp. PCC 6714]MCT0254944.1 heme A synthase [Synechocystis sp. CS-94]
MAESIFPNAIPSQNQPYPSVQIQVWIRRLVWKIAIATVLLMAVGSATRVMNAGLACPDWPLCYGQWIPSQQMNLQVFLEWFHRLDAALIGFSTLVLVGLSWWFRRVLPSWLPWAALGSLALILVQGLLGGLTVIELLRFDIVTAHLGTAMAFLGSLLIIALCLMPYQSNQTAGKLRTVALASTTIIYLQCLLGGLVGSQWAAHQCLAIAGTQFCQVLHSHLLGVLPTALGVGLTFWCTRRTPALNPFLRQLGNGAMALLGGQILLGVATLKLHLQIEPLTVAHHTMGICLWATLLAIAVLAVRDHRPTAPMVV